MHHEDGSSNDCPDSGDLFSLTRSNPESRVHSLRARGLSLRNVTLVFRAWRSSTWRLWNTKISKKYNHRATQASIWIEWLFFSLQKWYFEATLLKFWSSSMLVACGVNGNKIETVFTKITVKEGKWSDLWAGFGIMGRKFRLLERSSVKH